MLEDGERLLTGFSPSPCCEAPLQKHLRIGSPAEVIVSMAEEQNIDLIVMGARVLVPSGAAARQCVAPHPHLGPLRHIDRNGPVKAMKQILLPLVHSTRSRDSLSPLKPFHNAVELTLLTVLPSTEPPWPGDTAAAAASTEILEKQADYIEGVAARLRAIGYQAHGVAVVGAPSTMILQEATTLRSDLILMGTRGRQGMTRFVLGSVSHAVLHKTPCPVLAFH